MSSGARKARNFRRKTDDDEEEEEAVVVRPSASAAAAKKRVATKPLSFDAGDENSGVKLKRSKASVAMQQGDTAALEKRMRLQAKAQDAAALIASAPTVESSRPKYDLESLKAARTSRAPVRVMEEDENAIPTDAEIFTLADRDVDDADVEDEFIPLDVRSKYDAFKQAKGRVQREVLTSSVMDDENFDPLKTVDRRHEIEKALSDVGGRSGRRQGPVDDEEDEWQEEQIRRATAHQVRYDRQQTAAAAAATAATAATADRSMKALSSRLELVDLNAFTATMKETITALRSQSNDADRGLSTLRNDLAMTNAEIERLRTAAQEEAESFEWLQVMREYASNLVGCLREKQKLLHDLEEATFAMLRGSLQKRRQWRIDLQEDTLVKMRKEGRVMALGDYQPVAALKEADKPATVEVDEYGRERSTADLYEAHIQHRDQVRARRLQKRAANLTQAEPMRSESIIEQSEWELSDTEANDYAVRCSKLAGAPHALFRDTADEYRDIEEILRRFAEFRAKYPTKYQSAYISTSLVEVLAVHVQVDVLSQIAPLLNSGANEFDLRARPWFGPVERYCEESESDNRLISNLVGDAILPLLRRVASHTFDPRSSKSNRAMLALMTAARHQHPPVDAFADTIQHVVRAFEQEIRRICIPVLTTSVQTDAATLLAMRRQIVAASKLAKNLGAWQGFFTPANVEHLLWQLLFHRTKEALRKLLTITSNLYDVVDSSTLQYVLDAVRSYLMALLEASEMLGNVGSQDLMHKILHVSNEAHRLQPADAARRLSALFV